MEIATALIVKTQDRWGQEVYSWDGVHGYWDGKSTSGRELTSGVYYYQLSATRLSGKEVSLNGVIEMIRE